MKDYLTKWHTYHNGDSRCVDVSLSVMRALSGFIVSRILFTGLASSSTCTSTSLTCSIQGSSLHTTSTAMAAPAPCIVPAKKTHNATVIFLHGLGDSGDGWSDVFKHEIREDNIKYICPSSASRPVTLNMGMNMPAWFDLFGLDANTREDEAGIADATRLVHGMIDAEVAAGIPANRIVLGGFSMGGALALYAGITYPQKLAGIVGLSSFALQRNKLPGSHTANVQTNIFLGHGSNDFLVPLSFGELTEKFLKKFNPNVELHVYNGMAHSSSPQELRDVKSFIHNRLN